MVGKNSALTTSAYRAQQWLFMLASKSEPRNEDLHADAPRLYRLRSACRFPPGCTGPTGSALVLQIWLPASMDHREREKCGGGERVGLFALSRPQGQSRCLRARPDRRAEGGHHDGTSSKLSATRAFLCTLPRQSRGEDDVTGALPISGKVASRKPTSRAKLRERPDDSQGGEPQTRRV